MKPFRKFKKGRQPAVGNNRKKTPRRWLKKTLIMGLMIGACAIAGGCKEAPKEGALPDEPVATEPARPSKEKGKSKVDDVHEQEDGKVEEKASGPEPEKLEKIKKLFGENHPLTANFLAEVLRDGQETDENIKYLRKVAIEYLGKKSTDQNCLMLFKWIVFTRTTVPFASKVKFPADPAGNKLVKEGITQENLFNLVRAGNRKMRMFKGRNSWKNKPNVPVVVEAIEQLEDVKTEENTGPNPKTDIINTVFGTYPLTAQFLDKALRDGQETPENLNYLLEIAKEYLGDNMNDQNCLILFEYVVLTRTTVPFANRLTMPTNAAGEEIVADGITQEDVFGLVRAGNRKMRMFKGRAAYERANSTKAAIIPRNPNGEERTFYPDIKSE